MDIDEIMKIFQGRGRPQMEQTEQIEFVGGNTKVNMLLCQEGKIDMYLVCICLYNMLLIR